MKVFNLDKTALLVLSCDNYSDLWSTYIELFERFWPDCPLDKYFTTNYKTIPKSSFSEIKIGKDTSWSNGLIKTLDYLRQNYSYVLITLEDLPLIDRVDTEKFSRIVRLFFLSDGNYLKFIRKPKPTKKFNSDFGLIEAGSLYRPTCVYALWKIETLLEILDNKENAWEFERFGAVRSDRFSDFFVVNKDFFKIINTVVKGKWVPSELKKLKDFGLDVKIQRGILTTKDSFKLKLSGILFYLFTNIVPWRLRRGIVFKIKKI